jgi:multidrug transporter EmrE-like cation transporter
MIMLDHVYILLTILFTVYGQIVIKWQVNASGPLPIELSEKILFLLGLLLNPWVISGFACAFLASLSWMAAMTRFQLSYAYPFVSLTFVLTIICASIFFNESITTQKAIGLAAIVAGIIIGSQG